MSIGTITTRRHCVVNEKTERFAVGTRREIIDRLVTWRIDSERRIVFRVPGYPEQTLHSYTEEWTQEEMEADAVKEIFRRLGDYSFIHFRDIGF